MNAGNKEKEVHGNVLIEVDQFVWCGCSDGSLRLWDPKVTRNIKRYNIVVSTLSFAIEPTCCLFRFSPVTLDSQM